MSTSSSATEFILQSHRIAYRCSTTASAGTTLTRSTALTCIASYIPDNLNNHTLPRERGKIGVISGCPGREESVTDGASRARLWPPAGPSSGWVGGKTKLCVVQAANTGIMAGIPSVCIV
jgi:hypothetical protein